MFWLVMAIFKEFSFVCFLFVGLNSELIYVPKITDSVFECEDFNNEVLDCSGLVLGSKKGPDGTDIGKLGGTLVTSSELSSDYDIDIDIWKIMEMDDQYMSNMRVNFCKSLEDTDAPWYPVMQSLNITSCPVPPSTFEVAEILINLDSLKDVMCHEFCGEYKVQLSFIDKTDMITCHTVMMCIVEEEVDDEE